MISLLQILNEIEIDTTPIKVYENPHSKGMYVVYSIGDFVLSEHGWTHERGVWLAFHHNNTEFYIDTFFTTRGGDNDTFLKDLLKLLDQNHIKYRIQKDSIHNKFESINIPKRYIEINKKYGRLDEIEINPYKDEDHKEWMEFYKKNKDKVKYYEFESMDDVENKIHEIKDFILKGLKLGNYRNIDNLELDDKIHWTTIDRFTMKYGLEPEEMKYFFEGLKKYLNKTELNEIEIDKGNKPIMGAMYELSDSKSRKLKIICVDYEENTGMYNFSNEKKDEMIARCGIHEFKELIGQKRLKRIK